MKKILVVAALLIISACGKSVINEDFYGAIYEYSQSKIIEKGFDHKLSSKEKTAILAGVLDGSRIDMSTFMDYMKKNHPDDFKYMNE